MRIELSALCARWRLRAGLWGETLRFMCSSVHIVLRSQHYNKLGRMLNTVISLLAMEDIR